MAIRWCKLKYKLNRNRYFLHTICAGFVFFIIFDFLGFITDGSICPMQRFFGKRCFGCGMTNAFRSILVLDFSAAFEYNVLSIPLFIAIIIYSLLGFTDIIFDKNYIRNLENILSKKYMYLLYGAILLISMYYNNLF